MYFLLNAPFILDFAVTLILFGLCFIFVVGVKVVIFSVKELLLIRKQSPNPQTKKPTVKRKPVKTVKTVKPIRSIEINPEEIDQIYVKKIS